jgi:hypothetical protein
VSISFDRIVEIHAGEPPGKTGSGILVSDRHVLTARHVTVVNKVPVHSVLVRPVEDGRTVTGRLVWTSQHLDADLALVEISTPDWLSPESRSPRWGRLVGRAPRVPCEIIGFPRTARSNGLGRDTDHLSGHINPGAGLRRRRYEVHLDDSLPLVDEGSSSWAGLSGAALVVDGALVGIIVEADLRFGGRLSAVPVEVVAADPELARLVTGPGGRLQIEPADLAGTFRVFGGQARSPADLLRAEAETVRFRGRGVELDELGRWCDAEHKLSSWLLHGRGGQGKTRTPRT